MAQNVLPVVASHPHPLRPSPCAASHQGRTSPVPWAHPLLHKSCAQKIPKVLFLRLTSMAKKIQQFLAASLFRSVSSIFKRSERWRSASKCSDLPQAVLDVTPTCVLVEKLFESHPQWKVFQCSAVQGTMLVNQFWIAEHFRQVRRRYSCVYTIANHLGGNNYLRKTFTANRDGMEHTRKIVCRLVWPTNFDRLCPGTGAGACRASDLAAAPNVSAWNSEKVRKNVGLQAIRPLARHGETWRDIRPPFHLTSDIWHLSTQPWGLGALVHPSPTLTVSSASKIIKGLSSFHFKNRSIGGMTIFESIFKKKRPAPSVGKPSC